MCPASRQLQKKEEKQKNKQTTNYNSNLHTYWPLKKKHKTKKNMFSPCNWKTQKWSRNVPTTNHEEFNVSFLFTTCFSVISLVPDVPQNCARMIPCMCFVISSVPLQVRPTYRTRLTDSWKKLQIWKIRPWRVWFCFSGSTYVVLSVFHLEKWTRGGQNNT